MNLSTFGLGAALIVPASALVIACSSKTNDTPAPTTGTQSTAAAVAGPADSHCAGKEVVVVDPAACHPADAGEVDAGEADAGVPKSDFGATLFGSEGDDDDCKYHVKWTSTAVTSGADVTLAIVATNLKAGTPVAAAKPYAEIFLTDTHPGPNTPVQTTETSPGNYTIGPVKLDVSGKWTVRFHFAADCEDGETSPHGHVAFFLNVP
jgi:hypothetical protein